MPTSKLTRVRVEDLRENERPLLAVEHLRRGLAVLFQHAGQIDELLDLFLGQFFDGKEVFHQNWGCEIGRGQMTNVEFRMTNECRSRKDEGCRREQRGIRISGLVLFSSFGLPHSSLFRPGAHPARF
jgi:hypothetical protein